MLGRVGEVLLIWTSDFTRRSTDAYLHLKKIKHECEESFKEHELDYRILRKTLLLIYRYGASFRG